MDEDGDLAHEFYEERFVDKKGRVRYMKKLKHNLQPVVSLLRRNLMTSL